MTDPTPPRAPDAVPEAVRSAIVAVRRTSREYGESKHGVCGSRGDSNVHWIAKQTADALEAAILTALREATETRDQEIARLTTELAELRKRPTLTQMMETLHLAQHASPFRSSFAWQDAAHAIRQLYAEEQHHD